MEQRNGKHGLFRLYPVSYSPGECDVDIVAIHGLGGDAYNTWTDKDGHLWLRDSLPEQVPQARILTFGYDSAVMFGTSRMSIVDFAIDLLARLRLVRKDERERTRPLVFICHSLGGIVFKEFMVYETLESNHSRSLSKCVTGVVFLGTPHRGSRMASTAGILSRVINTATLGAGVRSDLLRALQLSSAELETISSHARALLVPLTIVSFYERKPLGPSLVVEPFSAILSIPNEQAIPLNADHRDVARLSPRKSHAYLPVWSSVKELVDASQPSEHFPTKELLDTLFCVDYKAAQLRSRQPHRGTCDWVFGNREYNSWMYSNNSAMLVLLGQAGIGKTVLTRFISETIMAGGESEASDIGYLSAGFYCSYYDEALNKHSEKNVLRLLLHQLIQLNPHCGGVVRNRLEKRDFYGVTIQLLPEYLWMALEDVLAMDTMRKTFITVDAIEELGIEEATSILTHLWRIVNQINSTRPQSRLRILISSRHHPEYSLVIPVVTILRLPI